MMRILLRSTRFHLNRHYQRMHPFHSRYNNVPFGSTMTITSAMVLFMAFHHPRLLNYYYYDFVKVHSFPSPLMYSFDYNIHHHRGNNNQYHQHRTLFHTLVRNIPTTRCAQASSSSSLQNDHENRLLSTPKTSPQSTTGKTNKETTTFLIPEPKHRHITLPPPPSSLPNDESQRRSGILVIGDVHGCYDELILLYQKAIQQNNNQDFHYIILVGDICNKGPQSMQVIRHMQQKATSNGQWICIRGNHENAVLRAYQEIKTRSSKEDKAAHKNSKYQWLLGEETAAVNDMDSKENHSNAHDTSTPKLQFKDEDYEWMSNLPYTIRIPANHIGLLLLDENNNSSSKEHDSSNNAKYMPIKNDIVIVHAGLIQGLPIEENDIPTMVTLRDLSIPIDDDDDDDDDDTDGTNTTITGTTSRTREMKYVPWASVWDGPELILFGHDAKRGLQLRYDNNTIGLDTGCVYGNQLTGMILPSKTIVQVKALQQHVPIVEK